MRIFFSVTTVAFNGIGGYTNAPGMIPWEFVAIYFVVAFGIVFVLGRRGGGLRRFSTMDLVYIGIGAALAVVWEFYVGAFLQRAVPSGLGSLISPVFWGRLFITFIIVGLVRKVGTGVLSLAIFNILSDIFFYGFGGEPVYTLYEALTYGLFIDMAIALTKGNIFGTKGRMTVSAGAPSGAAGGAGALATAQVGAAEGQAAVKKGLSPRTLAIVEGALLGLSWSFSDTVFYSGFFSPLLFGAVVNWARIIALIVQFIPGDIIIGIIAALAALRISRAV